MSTRGERVNSPKAWAGSPQPPPSSNKTNLSKGKIVTSSTFKNQENKKELSLDLDEQGTVAEKKKELEGSNRTKTSTNQIRGEERSQREIRESQREICRQKLAFSPPESS
jgi:hypothetical protein